MTFLRCRGSIRDMEKALGISYPTVCKRLDLVNALLGRGQALSQGAEVLRPGIVHRLDKGTSGIILVAKNDAAHAKTQATSTYAPLNTTPAAATAITTAWNKP